MKNILLAGARIGTLGLVVGWLLPWACLLDAQEPPPAAEPVPVVEPWTPEEDGPAFEPLADGSVTELPLAEPVGEGEQVPAGGARSARPGSSRGSGPRSVLTPAEPSPLAAKLTASTGDGTEEGIRLNFKDASLSQVLNYLSEAAGFIVVQEREVSGTVSITSHQPMSRDEAVELLNSVLVERGYAALRSGRILRIVSRSAARTMDLPVRSGSDPEMIPRRDELVTQIIPVRYADAAKLIENIRPLLTEDVTLTANESSNAMVITDTLTNIRRIAEIIRALDTSIANISVIRVFPLEYAGAREVAEVIREVFAPTSGGTQGAQGLQRMMEARFRMGGRGGGEAAGGTSEARQAASRVVAVADEFTNSLVVSAPDELMPTIEQIVQQLDSNIADLTEVRVFRLEHADASELANLVNQLYYDQNTTAQTQGRGGQGGPGAFFNRGRTAGNEQRSQRSLLQARVVAVGDPRTNTLIVSAARETMMTVAEMVGRLDASSDKRQQVFVVPLEHADVDNVAEVLRGMFETGTTTGRGNTRTTTGTGTSRLTQRVTQGADSANTTFNTSRGAGGGGR